MTFPERKSKTEFLKYPEIPDDIPEKIEIFNFYFKWIGGNFVEKATKIG